MEEKIEQITVDAVEFEKSQPTKQKVKIFKTRLFSLLVRYIQKSKSVSPLLSALSQPLFIREPQRATQLVQLVLAKQNIKEEELIQLRGYYHKILLYKSTKINGLFTSDYIKLLKRTSFESNVEQINEMVYAFLCQRKCTLKNSFFLFLARKITKLKHIIVAKCKEIKETQKLRPAQLKQANLLIKKLSKGQPVIKQEVMSQDD